jgi:hypothetical protein
MYPRAAGERSQTPFGTSSPPMCRLRSGTPASSWIATRSATTRSTNAYVDSSAGFITLSW